MHVSYAVSSYGGCTVVYVLSLCGLMRFDALVRDRDQSESVCTLLSVVSPVALSPISPVGSRFSGV